MSPAKLVGQRMASLLKARDNWSWRGGSHPDDQPGIVRRYQLKLKAFKDALHAQRRADFEAGFAAGEEWGNMDLYLQNGRSRATIVQEGFDHHVN